MTFHDILTTLKTDWHKFGVLFLVLKELRIFKRLFNIGKAFWNLRTPEGRASFWETLLAKE